MKKKNVVRDQNVKNFDCQTKELELYPEGNREALKVVDQGSS